jgi:aminoglycoside 6'-N-acetyltransferase
MGLRLRHATLADLELLRRWDEAPHVLASDPNDDWQWQDELARTPPWREQLIAELQGTPIGLVQLIDPREEDSQYWGEVAPNLRALDFWIGEERYLGLGCGTEIMRLALTRCFAPPAVEAVLIDPLASNVRAQRFYARLGFRAEGPRRFGQDDCVVHRLDRADWLWREQAARRQVIESAVFIAAPLERVWDALTQPELTERYWGGTRIESDWAVGSRIRYSREGEVTDEHMVLEIDPPRRLVQTFRPVFGAFRDEQPSHVELTLEAGGDVVNVAVRHDGFAPRSKVYEACRQGWPSVLSGLKTLLETGRPLPEVEPQSPRTTQESMP